MLLAPQELCLFSFFLSILKCQKKHYYPKKFFSQYLALPVIKVNCLNADLYANPGVALQRGACSANKSPSI